MTEYKILPPIIERGIYRHRLMERNGMVGFYETYLLKNPDLLYGYCVARITREKEARFKNGKVIPARERFPSPSRFGTHGFFYQPKHAEHALEHYHELVQKFSTPYPLKNRLRQWVIPLLLLRKKTNNWGGAGLSINDTGRGVARQENISV